jgi:hypothetical protein
LHKPNSDIEIRDELLGNCGGGKPANATISGLGVQKSNQSGLPDLLYQRIVGVAIVFGLMSRNRE